MSNSHKIEPNMLKVSCQSGGEPEIFHSIQGEGISMGIPSVFLRLATCNLKCSWCDTKYTWDWTHFDYATEVIELDTLEILSTIQSFGCPHVVITGGEPLLQQAELEPLIKSLAECGFSFEIETNGTITPSTGLLSYIDQWNVSPKLRTSGNISEERLVPIPLEFFSGLPKAIFKFVIATESDIDEVCDITDRYGISAEKVLLMPEGRTPEALKRKTDWLLDACLRHGFRFTTRLHIILWGNKRGR